MLRYVRCSFLIGLERLCLQKQSKSNLRRPTLFLRRHPEDLAVFSGFNMFFTGVRNQSMLRSDTFFPPPFHAFQRKVIEIF